MDGGDLELADLRALEASRFYDAAWEVPRGPLEGGAAARPVGGAVHTLSPEPLYAGLELIGVAGIQGVGGPQDDPVRVVMQDAVSVGEFQVGVCHPEHLAVPQHVGPVEDVLRLAAVGAGVHVHRAPDGTWGAGRELETGKAAPRARVGEDRVEDPGLGDDGAVYYLDAGEGLGEPDGQPADAAVAHQHVRSATEHGDRDAVRAGLVYGLEKVLGVPGL